MTIAIQAGGESHRMGRNKALLPLAGRSLIEHVLVRLEGLGDEIFITTNLPQDYSFLGLRLVSDLVPGIGTLAGLHTSLATARGDSVLVVACDMPFISRPLLEHLVGLAPQADVVIPHHGDKYEPLHAVYNRHNCLPALENALAAGAKRLTGFFPQVKVLLVEESEFSRLDPQGLSFFNINTPEDLAQAEKILAEGE
ncbi:MAG: molybdenum cofactor guanylyltransferase [Anaerolineales bacterium]